MSVVILNLPNILNAECSRCTQSAKPGGGRKTLRMFLLSAITLLSALAVPSSTAFAQSTPAAFPENSRAQDYGSGWECLKGFSTKDIQGVVMDYRRNQSIWVSLSTTEIECIVGKAIIQRGDDEFLFIRGEYKVAIQIYNNLWIAVSSEINVCNLFKRGSCILIVDIALAAGLKNTKLGSVIRHGYAARALNRSQPYR